MKRARPTTRRWLSPGLVFCWAVAEATVWPIMPDAILVPLALARPASWWRLVLASAAGTTLGGAISYLIGKRRPDRAAVERLPLVHPAMVTAADTWLAADGSRGVWRQPASGIPMKVFARVGGMRGLPPGRLLLWAVAARGTRFVVAAGGAALIAQVFRAHVTRWYWPLTLLWAVIFGVGLWRAVAFWERRAT